jgi:hypothetical protein
MKFADNNRDGARTRTTLSIQEIASKSICLNHAKISFVHVT